jgi:hypothetical protein
LKQVDVVDVVEGYLSEVKRYVRVSRGRILFRDPRGEVLIERLKDSVVSAFVGEGDLSRVYVWIDALKLLLDDTSRLLGGLGWSFPREFKGFLDDPRVHLRRKLFNYTFDLVRGSMSVSDYIVKARQAVTTSLKSNVRSLYQAWVFAGIVYHLALRGATIVYPEHRQILLERSGRQRAGVIPPNLILSLGSGELSFFLEAPRPVGWEDTEDLRRVWRLYVSLRPDMMVYSGIVLNIVKLDDPQNPILRPNVIIECKETGDWFKRVRILKGPLSKPLTAEEWMSRWIEGLWEGLGEAIGVSREEVRELLRGERRGLRVSEVKLLNLYRETFKPDIFIVVSEPKLDHSVRRELEEQDITVFDEVKIGDKGRLREVALTLESITGKQGASPLATLRSKVAEAMGSSITLDELMEALLELGEHRLEELLEILRSRRSRGDGMVVTS